MTQRLVKHPFLAIFDGPDTNSSTEARTHSTVPFQALYLMNNPFVHEQAASFARRLLAASPEPATRIDVAYELAWGDPDEPKSSSRTARFLNDCSGSLETSAAPRELASSKPGPAWPRSC